MLKPTICLEHLKNLTDMFSFFKTHFIELDDINLEHLLMLNEVHWSESVAYDWLL